MVEKIGKMKVEDWNHHVAYDPQDKVEEGKYLYLQIDSDGCVYGIEQEGIANDPILEVVWDENDEDFFPYLYDVEEY